MRLHPITRTLAIMGLSLAVLLLVMSARAVLESRAAAARASVALAAGDLDLAIVHLRGSARWYTPFNAYARSSLERLELLAQQAEARGEQTRALSAYRSEHAAIQATRSFYMPNTDLLERADERIAALMASEPPARIEQNLSQAQRKADYLALLVARDPNPWGVLLAFVGFVTWVGAAISFLSWGVDAEGRVLRFVARRSVLFLLAGWIAFAVGLRVA
ncbi:MAG: hypothetical protein JWN48_2401 [Myxococcaceae bacterium]|nr:hypothetical protein [Myxococcaceae bacterium]